MPTALRCDDPMTVGTSHLALIHFLLETLNCHTLESEYRDIVCFIPQVIEVEGANIREATIDTRMHRQIVIHVPRVPLTHFDGLALCVQLPFVASSIMLAVIYPHTFEATTEPYTPFAVTPTIFSCGLYLFACKTFLRVNHMSNNMVLHTRSLLYNIAGTSHRSKMAICALAGANIQKSKSCYLL